jgi:hypothetical protein
MDKASLIRRLEQAWNDFQAAYAGLDEREMLVRGVTGDWSVRDVLAHVTWWEQEALKYLPVLLAGGRPPKYSVMYGGIDAFNALMTEKTKNMTLDDVLREQKSTHERLIKLLEAAPGQEFERETKFRRRLRFDTYRHYPEHTAAILKWREGR